MKAKYIIVRQSDVEVPLVFSRMLSHQDVAGANQVVAAGFCEVTQVGEWRAGGWSMSLNLGARPQDADILNAHLGRKPAPVVCDGFGLPSLVPDCA